MKIITGTLAAVVIGINLFLVITQVEQLPPKWYIYFAIGIGTALYVAFVLYLVGIYNKDFHFCHFGLLNIIFILDHLISGM